MLKINFKTTAKEEKKNYGEFILSPLEQGYGHTLGNALRRVLLTAIPGAAITQIKIKGVPHQFTTLPGLKEDVVEFILNIKQIRVKVKRGEGPFKITLEAKGPAEIKADKIKTPPEIEIVNKDLVLGHLANAKSHLQAEMEVTRGFGYQLAQTEGRKIGVIPLDATFTPVMRVAYEVKATRVGRRTDLNKLILRLWTDGTIKPKRALERAAKLLVSHFQQIYQPVFEEEKEEKEEKEELPLEIRRLSIEEIGLPTRIANALIKGGRRTVGDLAQAKKEDLLKIKNLGEKSLEILKRKLKKKGVELAA